jgi:hypothetical protein
VGYAQYMALEPAGSWAELIRYERIRAEARSTQYTRRLWLIFVQEGDIADLSSFEDYTACGLDPRVAVGAHRASQELGDQLREAGYRGVLSPNAALPGATNLTLFGERYEKVLRVRPDSWQNPAPAERLPCHLAAEGSPPAELITQTCFVGMRHDGYREYLRDVGAPAPADPP